MYMRRCRWIPESGTGLEHLVVHCRDDAILAQGVVIGDDEGERFGASYTIECDAAWHVRHAVVDVAGGAHLELFSDGAGHWHDGAGVPLDALAGCIDVDLTASCFTNTLPLRRLANVLDRRQAIDVAWIAVPALTVVKAAQAYTRLGSGLVLFEGLDIDFRAELTIDADGFILRYPGLFARVL
ncbi:MULTISPECIES: putative glycolipid-binding domain-containing protein [unclassified Massilia]|uniref:putative glycolipid-binding domain-containing protein n=1 Tax=unclassified Massilia TaxID=2609279 RepID=UPI001E52F968|nr:MULTISPECIES: putative glycolipid-binding domain-containing protein [unclassified Massilia]